MKNYFDDIAKLIPIYSQKLLNIEDGIKEKATDIRFSLGQCPAIFTDKQKFALSNTKILNEFDMNELVYLLCENSVYKHMEEIKNGFISVKNQFRAGICGTAVIKDGEIENVSNINSIIIRIPRLIYGSADDIKNAISSFRGGLLIIGEPSSGKTTVLRDIIVLLSDERLVVLDERYELTSAIKHKDLDVLFGYPKKTAINLAIRNLGAMYIICDEIEEKDLSALENAVACGISIIATVHGNLSDGIRPLIKKLICTGAFENVVQLIGRNSPCKVKRVWKNNELYKSFRLYDDLYSVDDAWRIQDI